VKNKNKNKNQAKLKMADLLKMSPKYLVKSDLDWKRDIISLRLDLLFTLKTVKQLSKVLLKYNVTRCTVM